MDSHVKFFEKESWTLDYTKEDVPSFDHYAHCVNWVVEESGWAYLPIDLPNADYKGMLKEALGINDLFIAHRDGETHKGWSSVCIHGESFDRTQGWNDYPDNAGKSSNDIVYDYCSTVTDKCPITTNFIKRLPFTDLQRVRFMKLDPGGYILPHNDRDRSILNPLNIGLNQPSGCTFRMKDKGDVPFKEDGSACLVDISNIHSVWNNSNETRIHIIVHGTPLEEFNKLIYESVKKLCNLD